VAEQLPVETTYLGYRVIVTDDGFLVHLDGRQTLVSSMRAVRQLVKYDRARRRGTAGRRRAA
jgi:hypothetical protein